jgi:predicted RNA binding protein YcfA (HicA-like mRNA interferase family)
MNRLPVVSGAELCKMLAQKGYEIDHQKGSHIILRQADFPCHRLNVPNHKELPKGTLRAILRQAGLTADEFLELIK